MTRKIIGEGSYGCVHSPSLKCNTKGVDYKDKISKIMKKKHAEEEMKEFLIVGKVDTEDKYHLGTPVMCQPSLDSKSARKDISKCGKIKIDDLEAHPDQYALLVEKYGGPDLKTFCKDHVDTYLATDAATKVDAILLQVLHLLKGVKFFKTHGLVHYDLKPQNILLNLENGAMRFIDFGLMRKKSDIVDASLHSDNFAGSFHWSYPFDCGFMNARKYTEYTRLPVSRRTFVKRSLVDLIVNDSKANNFNLPINNPGAFSILFSYINMSGLVPDKPTQESYINEFFDGFNEMLKSHRYDYILDHTIDSIDVFGLGFSMQYLVNCLVRKNFVAVDNYTILSAFFMKMYDFNPYTRVIDMDTLITEYENVLEQCGVLTRQGKKFENGSLVPLTPALKPASTSSLKEKPLSAKLESLANEDIDSEIMLSSTQRKLLEKVIACPAGKEYNFATGRCVKPCSPGYTRNVEGKCRKTSIKRTRKAKSLSKSKSVKRRSLKPCKEGTERNPLTRRCVKVCKPGYIRNEKFKCIKSKTK